METIFFRNAFQVGHSLGITLPKIFCMQNHIAEKQKLAITVYDEKLVVEIITKSVIEKLEKNSYNRTIKKQRSF